MLEFFHTRNTGLVQRDRNQPQVCHCFFTMLEILEYKSLPTGTGSGAIETSQKTKHHLKTFGLGEFLFEMVSIFVFFSPLRCSSCLNTHYLKNKITMIYIFEEKVLIIEYSECECDHNLHILHI